MQSLRGNGNQEENIYDDGYLRIEHDNYYVTCGGQRITLPLKDFPILSRLARNAERVVPTGELWRSAWGEGKPVEGATLRVHIYQLRQKLAPYGISIESMVNVGYHLSCVACLKVKEGQAD
jgi:two-component system, OmpR family, response regulator RegX3